MGTIIVLAVVLILIGLAVYSIRKDKKSGKSSCGCGCSGCAMRDRCHGDNSQ
ncbi:MAG: FeoB-associated Cys-rich membrane protein [Ruminococcus sp.]|nr:FeoB-associated Cys-rich membrane protein [Ruminococcus sp.]MBQ7027818.1 FeoB-associated Cys-rich membrane protein [Ruminococcus sp.]MBQ8582437.1 FeoB-associated Cys-rich membrane protein [Ruminococcus sp.]